jgi:hypothetical protein
MRPYSSHLADGTSTAGRRLYATLGARCFGKEPRVIWRHLTRKTRTPDAPADEPDASTTSPRPPAAATAQSEHDQRRLAGLQRQRLAILFDIEQGELAAAADNPWTSRIALLGEAIDTVKADLARAGAVVPGPWHPLPPVPVTVADISAGDVSTLTIEVEGKRFDFGEEPDWAERGHQVARPELTRRSGDPSRLLPADTPAALRGDLAEHLSASLLVLATDLRDRALDGDSLPDVITLADLARPCPTCGGWTDWRGTCQACARRHAAVNDLRREEHRLLDERNAEAEHRHTLVEGLPLARRRLKDVETEIARVTG